MGSLIWRLLVIPSLIQTDLTDNIQKNKIHHWFSENERDHYITTGEICRIRKEVLKADIRLDANDAHLTQIWVDKLQMQGDFIYYKDKRCYALALVSTTL